MIKRVYMFIGSVDDNRGGLTLSMFKRAEMFNVLDIETTIVTFDFYQKDPDRLINRLRKTSLSQKTNHVNLFEYFAKKTIDSLPKRNKIEKVNLHLEKAKQSQTYHRVVDGTVTFYYNKYTGELKYKETECEFDRTQVNEFFNGSIIKTVNISDGQIRMIEKMINKYRQVTLFNKNNVPYAQINYHEKFIDSIIIFGINMKFKNLPEISSYFLNELISDNEENMVLVEGPGSFNKLIAMKHKNISRTAYIHSNHFDKPYTNGSAYKKGNHFILKNAHTLDYLFTLTDSQRIDILEDFPKLKEKNNIRTIPNFLSLPNKIGGSREYREVSSNHFGIVSRLVVNKGIQDIIKALVIVKEQIPEVNFDIYGEGPYKDQLLKLVKEKKLERNVHFKGYTTNVAEAYQNMLFSVSTSQHEGFGLSILESLNQGTPVISYDIKYGPSDMIVDGENGYLVEYGNVCSLAEKIIELCTNTEKLKKMTQISEEKKYSNFSDEILLKKWADIFS